MWYVNILGIGLEILGFVLMLKSTRILELKTGGSFASDFYADPKTGRQPPTIEGAPNPLLYRPGIWLVIAGLALQILDVVIDTTIGVSQ